MKIIECPRDAIQGIKKFIPTDLKISYINALAKVGFDTLDCGSFVSPKAIPQMEDTHEVINKIEETNSKILTIVANLRGAEEAIKHLKIKYLGFPLSLSETFQKRNTNKTIAEAFTLLREIQSAAVKNNKEVVVYLSMGFGNPYGDPYNAELLSEFSEKLIKLGIHIISLSDTVGTASEKQVFKAFESLIPKFPNVEFGAHLHSNKTTALKKIDAAYKAGCRRFDTALGGLGGCPMAKEDLTGNISTETLIFFLKEKNIIHGLNETALSEAIKIKNSLQSYF